MRRAMTSQTEEIPAKSVMFLVIASFACIMIASAFVADWFLNATVQRAQSRQATIQAMQSASISQPRIVGTPVTINPTPQQR